MGLDPGLAWGMSPADLPGLLSRAGPDYRVRSIAAYGTWYAPLFAAILHRTGGPPQVVEYVAWEALELRVAIQAGQGLFPAYLSGASDGSDSFFAVVFEEWFDPTVPAPTLAFGEWSSRTNKTTGATKIGFGKLIQGLELDSYIRSAALVRTSSASGTENPKADPGLKLAASIWPHEPGGTWSSSGLMLTNATVVETAADPEVVWSSSAMTEVMSKGASLVGVARTPPADGKPAHVLSLWQDVRYRAWPTPDLFETDPATLRERLGLDDAGYEDIEGVLARRLADRFTPISISARQTPAGNWRFDLVSVPLLGGAPLQRKLILEGPGDGRSATPDNPTYAPGSFGFGSSMASHTMWASRVGAVVGQAYTAHAIGQGHWWLEARPEAGALPGAGVPRPGPAPGPAPSGGGGIRQAGGGNTPVGSPVQAHESPFSTGSGPTAQPHGPAAGAAGALHPFDAVMLDILKRGARSGFLIVLRRGELKFARTYTLAETGYPIAKLHNRFRLGSLAKALTGTFAIRAYANEPDGLWTKIADEYGITPVNASLANATISDALRHATGLANQNETSIPVEFYANGNDGDAEEAAEYKRPLARLGTLYRWWDVYDDPDKIPWEVGTHYAYNGFPFSCVAECIGKRGKAARFDDWPNVFRDELNLAGAMLDTGPLGGRSYAACNSRGEVPYHHTPGVAPTRWRRVATEDQAAEELLPYVLLPYDEDVPLRGASGGYSLNPLELGRFLAALTPRTGPFNWHDLDQLSVLKSTQPWIVDGSTVAVGWGSATKLAQWPASQGPLGHAGGQLLRGVTRLQKNGGIRGADAWMWHQMPTDLTSAEVARDTFSLAFVVSRRDTSTAAQRSLLLEIAENIERKHGWPAGDLFDAL